MSDLAGPDRGSTPGTAAAGTPAADRGRWFALAVVLSAAFMDLLDVTIVNVAVPSIQHNLNAGYSDVQWVIAGYALAFAVVLITGGRLGDIYGRKRLFMTGMVGFTFFSALCGVATGPEMLLGSRLGQGAFAALMVPQVLAIIHVTFPAEERGKVFGMYGAIVGMAAVSGPIIGGLLVQWNLFGLHWRPIFLVNVPVGIISLIAAARYVRESKSPRALRLDLVGMLLTSAAVFLFVFPLVQGRDLGWPVWGFVMMALAIPIIGVFVVYERYKTAKDGSPLVALNLFGARTFTAGLGTGFVFNSGVGVFFLVWTLYMQLGLGWTPLHAGLTGIAFSIGVSGAAGMSVQFLTPRFGRKVLQAGALLMIAGFLIYIWEAHRYGLTLTSWQMSLPLFICGVGMGLIVAPITDLVLTDVPRKDSGSASGLLGMTQQLGTAIGIALVAVVFFNLMGGQAAKSVNTITPTLTRQLISEAGLTPQAADQVVAGFKICAQDRAAETDPSVIPASCQPSPNQPANAEVQRILAAAGTETNGLTFSRSFQTTLWFVIAIMLLVFSLMFYMPRKARHIDPDAGFDEDGS